MHPFLLPPLLLLSLLPPTTTTPSLTSLMSKTTCKTFSDLLRSSADASASFASNLPTGLTAFCPADPALIPFLPRFNNLSSDHKLSLLLFHATPIYYSIQMLKSNNGVLNTLATDGISNSFNFTVQNDGDHVTLQTKVSKAKIVQTLFDGDPVALYSIDEVLQPLDLFKPAPAPVEAEEKGKGRFSPAASLDGKAVDSSRAAAAAAYEGKFVAGGVVLGAAVFALLSV